MTILRPITNNVMQSLTANLFDEIAGITIPTPSIDLTSPSNQTIAAPDGLNAQQGTILIEVLDNQRQPNTNEFLFYIGDGGTNNSIYLQKRNSGDRWRFLMSSGGVNIIVRDFPYEDMLNGVNKILVSWDDNYFTVNINGTQIILNNQDIPTPLNVSDGVSIGQFNSGGVQPYQRTINAFKYWPLAFTKEQIHVVASNNDITQGETFSAARDGYVFIGESNASGRSNTSPTYDNTNKQMTNALSYANYADPYDTNTGAVLTNLNETTTPLASFAGHTIDQIATNTGRETFAIPACRGGASTQQDYTLNVASGSFDLMGNIGFASIQQIKASMAFGGLKAVVISLGVNDAILGTDKAVYKAALKKYVDELRLSLQMPKLKVVYLSLHERAASGTGATQAQWDDMSNANLELAASDSNGVGVDISDIVGITGDTVHFGQTEADLITIGSRIAGVV